MPPDTLSVPRHAHFAKIHFELRHAQTLMQQRLTHLERIFCQLSDGPNFFTEHFGYSLCNAHLGNISNKL
jgi:hypothetical protein